MPVKSPKGSAEKLKKTVHAHKERDKKKNLNNNWVKEAKHLQAVIICDSFDKKFIPLTEDRPRALLPIIGKSLLHHTFDILIGSGVVEFFVLLCWKGDMIRNFLEKNGFLNKNNLFKIHIVTTNPSDCITFGDAMREIDRVFKSYLHEEFIMVNAFLVGNLNLKDIMDSHKKNKIKDKDVILTVVFREELLDRSWENEKLITINDESNNLIFYQNQSQKSKLKIPLTLFKNNNKLTLNMRNIPISVFICTPIIPQLFSDNFDFQNMDDLIKGVLNNREVLGHRILISSVGKMYVASINDMETYYNVTHDLISRWAYPITPNIEGFSSLGNFVYISDEASISRGAVLSANVIVGDHTNIDDEANLSFTVVGSYCSIGRNVHITESFILDGTIVEDNCIIKHSIVGFGCIIKSGIRLNERCLIKNESIIGPNIEIPPYTFVSKDMFNLKSDINLGADSNCGCKKITDEEIIKYNWGNRSKNINDSLELIGSDLSEGSEERNVQEFDNENQFFNEVMESLQFATIEKPPIENMILEINSSKHAYNIELDDMIRIIVRIILAISFNSTDLSSNMKECAFIFEKNIGYFDKLLINYLKNTHLMILALISIENFFMEHQNILCLFKSVLFSLYEHEILSENAIIEWYEVTPSEDSLEKFNDQLKNKYIYPFIKWLREASEESSDD